jgi:hypothetical protein
MPRRVDDEFESPEVEELRAALRRAQAAEARAKSRTEDLVAAVYQAARDAALVAYRPRKPRRPKRDRRSPRGEIALVHATDWQAGKKTASYGLDVLRARIGQFTEKIVSLTEVQRSHHPVREVVVMLGGDMVEGLTVFPGQAYEVEAHLFEQVFVVVDVIDGMLRHLAENFETVRVVAEYGNHGRIGRRGDVPAADNLDRIAYKIAQERTKDLAIPWQASDAFYQLVKVGDAYRALLVHGDEINSYGGALPAYGIVKKVSAWSSGVVEQFHDAYLGHFHQPLELNLPAGGRIFVTPSPESDNVYAKSFVAASGRPAQRLHFVSSDKPRVTAQYLVWLD